MALEAQRNWSAAVRDWSLPLAWMALIFWFSTGSFSSANTAPLVDSFLARWFPTLAAAEFETINLFIRKLGHWSEYFVLAVLVLRALDQSALERSAAGSAIATVLWVFLYAVSDEFHQYFVPSRMASFIDVLLDTFGGLCGVFFPRLWQHKKQRKAR